MHIVLDRIRSSGIEKFRAGLLGALLGPPGALLAAFRRALLVAPGALLTAPALGLRFGCTGVDDFGLGAPLETILVILALMAAIGAPRRPGPPLDPEGSWLPLGLLLAALGLLCGALRML